MKSIVTYAKKSQNIISVRIVAMIAAILVFMGYSLQASAQGILGNFETESILSENIYDLEKGGSPPNSFELLDYTDKPENGFTAATYREKSTGKVFVVFGGTTAGEKDLQDVRADIRLVMGWGDDEVQLTTAKSYLAEAEQYGSNITVTGHSLGGALAMYAGARSDYPVVTFNSAPYPLSADDLSFDTSNITNIRTNSDPLSGAQKVAINIYNQELKSEDLDWLVEAFEEMDYDDIRAAIDSDPNLSGLQRNVAIGLLNTHKVSIGGTKKLVEFLGNTAGHATLGLLRSYFGVSPFVDLDEMFKGEQVYVNAGSGHSMTELRRDIISDENLEETYNSSTGLNLYYVDYVPYPAQTGTIEETVEFSGSSGEEEVVSFTATNPNADLTNETVTEIIEEAEPETEPPVTTPLWAGRMSLTGRVNAGLNPATGVVGAMEASGDAPISEFILFNPETGTINTPLHGSQTSANIGHTFNHLIWGDWSGGSRTWTTSSYPVNQLSGFFVYGELTPPDARTTGTATYTGRLRGDIIANGNIEAGTAYGDFGLTANFGTGSLGGWLAFADTNSSNYAFVSDIENARIVRQSDRLTFSGDLSGEGITGGNIDGYFFGPNATELGGTYEVAGSDGNSSSSGILLGWETGTMPDRPDNPTSMNFPLYVSYSSTSGAIFDRGDDGIGKTPEMGDTLTLTIDGTPTRVTEVYDTTNDQFDYTSWGGWTGGAPSSPFNEGYWVAGQETPSSVIENLTGTATYSGDIRGDYVSAGTRHDATGNINLTADFSNDRITGDMMFHAQTGNGSVSAGTLGLQSDIRSDGSFFQSTSSHGFQGNFYGPNAEEAGGTAWLTTNDGSFNGVFRANQ